MSDVNIRTWLVLGLVAMGLSFEVIKRLPRDNALLEIETMRLNNVADPYVATRTVERPARLLAPPMKPPRLFQGQHDSLPPTPPQATEFKHGEATDKKDVKKKKDDEWEIVVDPKTGKKIKRKKKKKKRMKLRVMEEEAIAQDDVPVETENDSVDSALDTALTEGFVAAEQTPPQQATANLEDWIRRLLNYPDTEETKRFVQAYLSGSVGSDVFYQIVQMMVKDSRVEMQKLGVLAAGLTPSAMSFYVLADVIQTQSSSSPVRIYSEKFVEQYSTLARLNVLEQVLSSNATSYATLLATQRLDVAIQRYLVQKQSPPANGDSGSSETKVINASKFMPFINILTALSASSEPSINDQAKRTLATLQAKLGQNGTTT